MDAQYIRDELQDILNMLDAEEYPELSEFIGNILFSDGETDYEKAFYYYSLGAFSGSPISLYKKGDMYQNGYYVEKNEKEAFFIYEHCINLLDDDSAKDAAGPVFLRPGKAYLYGKGTEENAQSALICFQKAEMFLYDMVMRGDKMYRKSLQGAIDGQAKAREKLLGEIF